MHEITAGHRSLSGTISCVTNRIRFLPVTLTSRFSNFNSTSYTEDLHKLRVTGTKCRLPDTISGTGEIFLSGAEQEVNQLLKESPFKEWQWFTVVQYRVNCYIMVQFWPNSDSDWGFISIYPITPYVACTFKRNNWNFEYCNISDLASLVITLDPLASQNKKMSYFLLFNVSY